MIMMPYCRIANFHSIECFRTSRVFRAAFLNEHRADDSSGDAGHIDFRNLEFRPMREELCRSDGRIRRERRRRYRVRNRISRGQRRVERGNDCEYRRRMKVRDTNRAAIRHTCGRALRKFLLCREAMEMRRRKRLPEQQHHRRHEGDIAQKGFIAMLGAGFIGMRFVRQSGVLQTARSDPVDQVSANKAAEPTSAPR